MAGQILALTSGTVPCFPRRKCVARPDDDGGKGQTLLVGVLILVFLAALAGLVYLTLLS